MEYLDYYFDRNNNYATTNGIVNRKIRLVNIFYPNLIRSEEVLINSSTVFIRQNSIPAEIRTLTFENRSYNLNDFVEHVNQWITNNFAAADLQLEIVNVNRVRWVNSSQNVIWRILLPRVSQASFFNPTGETGQLLITAGNTTEEFIPDLTSGISNLEIRFSDNNVLQVPWVGRYLSQIVYSFNEHIPIQLKNANRLEIRVNYGGANEFNILTCPLRRVLRLGFVEDKN